MVNGNKRNNKLWEFHRQFTASVASILIDVYRRLLEWCKVHELKDFGHSGNQNRLDVSRMDTSNTSCNGVINRTDDEIDEIMDQYNSLKNCVSTIKIFVESGKTEDEWQMLISDEIVPLLGD